MNKLTNIFKVKPGIKQVIKKIWVDKLQDWQEENQHSAQFESQENEENRESYGEDSGNDEEKTEEKITNKEKSSFSGEPREPEQERTEEIREKREGYGSEEGKEEEKEKEEERTEEIMKKEKMKEEIEPEIQEDEPRAEIETEPEIQEVKGPSLDVDAELEEILSRQKATIKVVGSGGGGNNTINRMSGIGIVGVETIAVNTDAQDLLFTNADKKIMIGKEVTKGLGAGSMPKIGEEAARESEHEIKKAIQGADMVFVTCGLGGGTGTGSAPVIAEIGKKLDCLTVAIVTMPFSIEGRRRYENAVIGLEKLENVVDTLIVIPNDKLLELAPDLPLQTAFKVADELLTNAVKGIAEMITRVGLVNLDFADIKTIMGDGGVSLIGVGEADSENRALESVEKAINNPLLDVDISEATGALINIVGGPGMTLEESKKIVEKVAEHMDEDAKIIWGAQLSEDLQKTVRTMLIITGVKSSQIFGTSSTLTDRKKEEMSEELGIEFV